MKALRKWMLLATKLEQEELAVRAGTSREYLYQIANGIRSASAAIAGNIEKAARELRKGSKGRLPKLTRADLSATCGACPYAVKCLGNK